MRGVLWAVLLFTAFLALGAAVSLHPPGAFDRSELGVFGVAVPFAEFCRSAGLFPTYAALCALALVGGLVWRAYLGAALWLVGLMLVIWKVSDAFKAVFHRPRPEHWLGLHETSASYPSGHATLSVAFYGFVAVIAWRSLRSPAARATIAGLCLACSAALGWSRLALGAHFPTDVLGGYLLGGAGLCCALFAYDRTRDRVTEPMPNRVRGRYTR